MLLKYLEGVRRGFSAVHVDRQAEFLGHVQLGMKEVYLIILGMGMRVIIQPGLSDHVRMVLFDYMPEGNEPFFAPVILKILRMYADCKLKALMPVPKLSPSDKVMSAATDYDGVSDAGIQHPLHHFISVIVILS